MLEWLVDHAVAVYVVLGLIALGLLVALWLTRKRPYALGLVVVLAAAALFALLTLFVPTDQTRIIGAIKDMEAGVRAHSAERIFANISDQFRLGGLDKTRFRQWVDQHVNQVDTITPSDFDKLHVDRVARRATLEFNVKPKGPLTGDTAFYLIRATFVLDPDDRWRLKTFEAFNPFVDSDRPMDVGQYIR
jgi:hypothetical protein